MCVISSSLHEVLLARREAILQEVHRLIVLREELLVSKADEASFKTIAGAFTADSVSITRGPNPDPRFLFSACHYSAVPDSDRHCPAY